MMVAMQVEGNGPAGAAQRAREAQRLPTITGWTRLLLLDVRDVDLEAQTFVADVDIQVRCPGLRARLSALYGADACSEALGSWPMQWRLDQRLWIRNAVEEVSTERWFDVSKEAFRLRFVGKLSARCRHEDFPFDAFKLPDSSWSPAFLTFSDTTFIITAGTEGFSLDFPNQKREVDEAIFHVAGEQLPLKRLREITTGR